MLRDFQDIVEQQIFQAWGEPNVMNVMPVMPTGSGKTVLVGDIVVKTGWPSAAIAHRQELVGQMSLALNREHVPHGLIAPKAIQRQIISLHHDTHGYSMYNYRADTRVAGVDTLLNHDKNDRWLRDVALVIQDEGHHVLLENKWGKAMQLFPNARGLFPTAHAIRADGRGLGRHADGLVDRLIVGPSCRELINRGFLTDYRILCPDSDIDFSDVPISSTGDYSLPQLRSVTHQSNRIVGDVVRHYLKYAAGKLGVTFAVDIEAATQLARAYNAAGVPAEIITAKTPLHVRGQLMRQFRNRLLLQLVSVDCLGEGVDVPAIEVISMVRKTASFQLFAQQFGRSLRPMVSEAHQTNWHSYSDEQRIAAIAGSEKPRAIVIDHVGNFMYFAAKGQLVDAPQQYSLDRRESRSRPSSDAIPLRSCTECIQPYERYLLQCPYCGNQPVPAGRSSPEQVEGDLIELDPAIFDALRKEIARVDGIQLGPVYIQQAHLQRQRAQATLRVAMRLWGAWKEQTLTTRDAQRLFWHTFDVDVLTAMTLGSPEAAALEAKIREQLDKNGVHEVTLQ